jgi:hypothetical protein
VSVWREVQERLYARWQEGWANTTPYAYANEPYNGDPEVPHVRFRVQQRPGGPGTLGRPGNRKMDRRGVVFAILREPPGKGVGTLSDLAEKAKNLFEGCSFAPYNIRFQQGDVGDAIEVEGGRWWGVTVELPFDYEEIK